MYILAGLCHGATKGLDVTETLLAGRLVFLPSHLGFVFGIIPPSACPSFSEAGVHPKTSVSSGVSRHFVSLPVSQRRASPTRQLASQPIAYSLRRLAAGRLYHRLVKSSVLPGFKSRQPRHS